MTMSGEELKRGELRILNALARGKPLGNVELQDEAEIKSSTIRSRYLRNLRKRGLIAKDIDTHKYKLIAHGWEMLYLTDILNLMKERIDVAASVGLEDAGIGWWQFEFIISDDPSIPRLVQDLLTGGSEESLETRLALSKVLDLVDGVWRRRSIEAFNVEERKVIEGYMEKLSDAAWILYGDREEEQQTALEIAGEVAEQRLARQFPSMEITREMVYLEAKNQYKRVMLRRRRIIASRCPDVEALKKALESTERNLTDSTYAKLNEIISNLEEPDRRKLYELYLENVMTCPKSLIVSPSSVFRDYQKMYLELFPEKNEAVTNISATARRYRASR